jgi:hypothetical protein
MVKEIALSFAKVQLYDPELVRVEVFGEQLIGLPEARQINDLIGVLSGGRETRVLMVADEVTQFEGSAREFSASEEGTRYTRGDAFVVKNTAQRLLVSFYLSFNKPKKPSKLFNNETDAFSWLYSL